jgi:hypothetical protein
MTTDRQVNTGEIDWNEACLLFLFSICIRVRRFLYSIFYIYVCVCDFCCTRKKQYAK